jgi:hypothetical protein
MALHRKANWHRKLEMLSTAFVPSETCGLHVHVSRRPLNDRAVDKLIKFVYLPANRAFIKSIARRENERYARMTVRGYSEARNNRYQALNLTNDNTVEFRMFAATLDPIEFYGSLEFSHALTRFARLTRLTEADMTKENFMNYVNGSKRSYSSLKTLITKAALPAPSRGFGTLTVIEEEIRQAGLGYYPPGFIRWYTEAVQGGRVN